MYMNYLLICLVIMLHLRTKHKFYFFKPCIPIRGHTTPQPHLKVISPPLLFHFVLNVALINGYTTINQ